MITMSELKEFRVSNDAMNDPDELQRRIDDEGYLFFKRLVEPDKLWELRREMMSMIQEVGWLVAERERERPAFLAGDCTQSDRSGR